MAKSVLTDMRILVDMVDPLGVEQRGAALDAMHLVALLEQKLGQVRSVLPGNPGDKRPFCQPTSLCL